MKNVFNKITRVATSSPNLNLNDLLDVNTNTATNNQVLRYAGGTWVNSNDNGITSINLVMPNNTFDVIGSPLTSNGEIVVNYAVQAQNQFLATPISSSGQPSFRGIQFFYRVGG